MPLFELNKIDKEKEKEKEKDKMSEINSTVESKFNDRIKNHNSTSKKKKRIYYSDK